MRHIYTALISVLLISTTFFSCRDRSGEHHSNQADTVSKPSIYTKKPGTLTVLVDNSVSSYFIYRGEPKGFEYELLDWFAESHHLKLDVKVLYEVDNILDSLAAGKGDVAAANLTINRTRLKKVDFTDPLLRTKQVLVQRLPENYRSLTADEIENSLIRDILDLEGDTVVVRKKSSFYSRLVNYSRETNTDIIIKPAPGDMETENLVEQVSNGSIDYTISDANKARLLKSSFKNIDINTEVSLSQKIGWAVNKQAKYLLDTLNNWLESKKGSLTYNVIYNRYFKDRPVVGREIESNYTNIKEGTISPYDKLIRQYAKKLNWDWRLLAALINQESRFNPQTESWAGAKGLMQVMPSTSQSFGISTGELYDPNKNLKAGTDQLHWLKGQWENVLTDSLEIIKFTLGSYNAGYGHVSDARRLAKVLDKDPNIWTGNVEEAMLKKSLAEYYTKPMVKYGYCRGSEPVEYVKKIFDYYELYKEFSPQ